MFTTARTHLAELFGGREERCLVIEEAIRGYLITEAVLYPTERRLTVIRRYRAQDFQGIRRRMRPFRRGIVVLDGRRAATVAAKARVRRADGNRPIDEGELDTLMFKALWEFLNHYRSWAAKKFGVADLDLALASIEVVDVLLDGHRVLNPIGFKGSVFEAGFRGTLVVRSFTEALRRFHGWVGEFVIAERGSGLAEIALRTEDALFVDVGTERAQVFAHRDENISFARELPWGSGAVASAVADRFLVDQVTAGRMLAAVASGRASERFTRAIDRIARAEVERFATLVASSGGGGKRPQGPIAVHVREPLPRLQAMLARQAFTVIDDAAILSARGFSRTPSEQEEVFGETLAMLTYPYHHPHYRSLNQLLRRRARWLIAQPQ